jgi:hypothetical protein
VGEQQFLAARLRQELHPLPHGNVAPPHDPLLQGEIVGGVGVGSEIDAVLGVAPVARGPDREPIFTGRKVVHAVLAFLVRQHADGDPGLGIARLNKGAAKSSAIRVGNTAGNRRGLRRRTDNEQSQNSRQ